VPWYHLPKVNADERLIWSAGGRLVHPPHPSPGGRTSPTTLCIFVVFRPLIGVQITLIGDAEFVVNLVVDFLSKQLK
jgi:hypothetical protein